MRGALVKAIEIIEWVSMTKYEREAVAADLAAIKLVAENATNTRS